MRLTKEELLNLQNHDELLAEVDRLRLDNDSMKKELDFWTKSTTMGARDWCDRLRQAEQKFREAAEKSARLEEALRFKQQVGPACAYDKLRSRSLF